jgi:hypothetical protein
MKTSRTSNAYVQKDSQLRTIRILDFENPEVLLAEKLRQFTVEVGYSEIMPHFQNLRIHTVHPFAMLLYQSSIGENLSMDMFPSVTVADSTDSQTEQTLGFEESNFALREPDIAHIRSLKDQQKVWIGDSNLNRLENAVSDGSEIMARSYRFQETHQIDFNIWAENKDVTSFLFDMVKAFIYQYRKQLYTEHGIALQGGIQGRRSGDINVDFERLLYGSNVTVTADIAYSTIEVDIPYGLIDGIVLDPHYHELEE